MQPVQVFKRAPEPEPTIRRYTIRSPAEADEPRSRLELNTLRALGAIVDKRAWWTKWTKRPEVQRQWMQELDDALVRANVSQVLAVWPRDGATDELRAKVRAIAALTNQRQKKREIEDLLAHVLFPANGEGFTEGGSDDHVSDEEESDEEDEDEEDEDEDVEGEDDSDDETALDEDGNVVAFDAAVDQAKKTHGIGESGRDVDGDATMSDAEEEEEDDEEDLLTQHKNKNPFGQVAWYVTMSIVREKLEALAPTEWTDAAVSAIVDAASVRVSDEIINRSCGLILAVLRANDRSIETVKTHVPNETRDDVLALLQLHFEAIYDLLDTSKRDLASVLDVVVACLALPAKDEVVAATGALRTPGPVPYVWMSDDLIPSDLKATFASQVAVLENVEEVDKDWHPDSNGQVLDLVHPSLFCGVVGQTLRLPKSAAKRMYGSAVEHMTAIMFAPAKSKLAGPKDKSTKFQWLPCEIDIDEADEENPTTTTASILTYINNLHPETHAGLYRSIEQIFSRFVPLFETVLSSLDDQASDRAAKGLYEHGQATLPCAPALVPPGLFETTTPQLTLRGSQCQVIIKIAEIHLTPAKPTYPGGSWHIEGTDAERIIATGLYYFGSDNIRDSRLSFRSFVQRPDGDDAVDTGLAYGLTSGQPLVQHLGSLTALEDRCVVFPNIYQHKVEPFELLDPSRPGVRKLLAFFLVDPTDEPIASTAVVPPQQQTWIDKAREPQLKRLRLPPTVAQQVQDGTREGLSLEAAKIHRVQLMAERSRGSHDSNVDTVFSLCEH